MEFEGEIVGGTIVYGEDEAEPLLAVTALESGGFEVDPRSQKLKRLPAVLLKSSGALRANLQANCGPGTMIRIAQAASSLRRAWARS